MSLGQLRQAIENRTARLGVIGMGYVGLPLACEFARVGYQVTGVDIQPERVAMINSGISPIEGDEPGLAELLALVISSSSLHATLNYAELTACQIILVAVETPVDENHQPGYESLRRVLSNLREVLAPDSLVIIESTLAPGTINGLVLQELQAFRGLLLNRDFYLGHCPERLMPGKLLHNIRSISRVVGGMTPETADIMCALYSSIVKADLDAVDCLTAELVKTVENAYRDVQIAFANEVALICEAVGGDAWQVRELVNKTPYRQMHLPGAGVGGHCIPKDPWLLAYAAGKGGVSTKIIPAARQVNDQMPLHLVEQLASALSAGGKTLKDSRILVMGYAYLEDSDDTRNSPSAVLVRAIEEAGAMVVIHDPYISQYSGDLLSLANGCDAAVVMVRHKMYRELDPGDLKRTLLSPILVDGRKVFEPGELHADGWISRTIGIGIQPEPEP